MSTDRSTKPQILSLAYHPTDINVLLPVYLQLRDDDVVDLKVLARTDRVFETLSNFAVPFTDDLNTFFRLYDDPSTSFLLLAADFKCAAHMMGSWACYIAREKGIPSLSIQHGLFLNESSASAFKTFTADRMAVWGSWFYDFLVKDGSIDNDKLIITGNPYFDGLPLHEKSAYRAELIRAYGLDEDRPRILLAMAAHALAENHGVSSQDIISFIRCILEGCPKEAIVFVKPHPAEAIQGTEFMYLEAANAINRDVVVVPTGLDTRFFVLAVDVVVTQLSTVLVEAHLCHTPTISVIQDNLMQVDDRFARTEGYFLLKTGFSGFQDELREKVWQAHSFVFRHEMKNPLSDVYEYARVGSAAGNVCTTIYNSVESANKTALGTK